MDNDIAKKYLDMFGEMPFLLTTQSYEDEDYQVLMLIAINRGSPLTEEEIAEYFQNDYDLVTKESVNKKIQKNPNDLAEELPFRR